MKYSLSSPNKNTKFHKTINKLLLHDLKDAEPKSKVLSKIQKKIKNYLTNLRKSDIINT